MLVTCNTTYTHYHGVKFSSIVRCDHKIFYVWRKTIKFRSFLSYNCLYEICCGVVKNTHCYQFLCKNHQAFSWKILSRILRIWLSLFKLHSLEILKTIHTRTFHQLIKIILINENSYLQMFPTRRVFSHNDL